MVWRKYILVKIFITFSGSKSGKLSVKNYIYLFWTHINVITRSNPKRHEFASQQQPQTVAQKLSVSVAACIQSVLMPLKFCQQETLSSIFLRPAAEQQTSTT